MNKCQQCGDCCRKNPCDIIPYDLLPLLDRFKMNLRRFYEEYLIALMIKPPHSLDVPIFMMVPVKVDSQGKRYPKYLADIEYIDSQKGPCIFLKDNKCSIHDLKPYGGRLLECKKMTGGVSNKLSKNQCLNFWVNSQHLFEKIFPGFTNTYKELKVFFIKIQQVHSVGRLQEPKILSESEKGILEKLYLLFNGIPPVQGHRFIWNNKQ